MIKLNDFKQYGFYVTWKLIDIGFRGNDIFKYNLEARDIINYAIEKIENNSEDNLIYELASMYETETEEINKILKKLSLKEKTTFNLEFRKWRIIYVINTIKNIDENDYISGLIELGDLWEKLGYPQDTPHIIQGRFNTFTPEEYYTEENYKFLLIKHKKWIISEMKFILRNQV